MPRVRVLLADDHTVVRQGVRMILEASQEIEVMAEVGDGTAAIDAVTLLAPDVVLMDVSMPGMNGIEATRAILKNAPTVRILMLSMHGDEQYLHESLEAGACGYLLKDVDDHDLVDAVLTVGRGGTYFSARLRDAAMNGPLAPGDGLSPREREVLALIATGLTNQQIAVRLEVSPHTIDTHRKHIMEKLCARSTAELVRYAVRHGLTSMQQ